MNKWLTSVAVIATQAILPCFVSSHLPNCIDIVSFRFLQRYMSAIRIYDANPIQNNSAGDGCGFFIEANYKLLALNSPLHTLWSATVKLVKFLMPLTQLYIAYI